MTFSSHRSTISDYVVKLHTLISGHRPTISYNVFLLQILNPGHRSSFSGFVHDVQKGPAVYTAGGGALPGLTPEETAILAGVLTGA